MRVLFGLLLLVHGLLHGLGFAKAFGLAELPQLSREIARPLGLLWLLAMLLMLGAALALFAWPRGFWIVGGLACVLSQVVICQSWIDAKFGTIANVLLLLGIGLSFAAYGPFSSRVSYERDIATRAQTQPPPPPLTEADLSPLPACVQRYVRHSGAVGKPQVRSMRLRFAGQIRSSAQAPWMPFTAEQHSFFAEPARLFLMAAERSGIPFDVFHRFANGQATMRVRIASLFPMIDARGADLTRAETVTLLNDMAVMAPATLIDRRIRWEALDPRRALAHFSLGENTVKAELVFAEQGELLDFISDDRSASSPDGKVFTRMRWSTPLREYRWFGPAQPGGTGTCRLAARAETLWHDPSGTYAYGQFELLSVDYNIEQP